MSQAGSIDVSSSPVVPTTFPTDVNSPAIPAANTLNVLGDEVFLDRDEGIYTDGGSGSNTLTIFLSNRVTSSTTTTNATPTALLSQALTGAVACYNFEVKVVAYNTTDSAGAGFSLFGTIQSDGATATLLGTSDFIKNAAAAMDDADVELTVTGNSAVVQVTGIAGKTINWKSLTTFAVVEA